MELSISISVDNVVNVDEQTAEKQGKVSDAQITLESKLTDIFREQKKCL